MDSVIFKVISQFSINGQYTHGYSYGLGHINDTYIVFFQNSPYERYILQKINTNVFKKPQLLMENLCGVTEYLQNIAIKQGKDPMRKTLNIIPCIDGRKFYIDPRGHYWRCFNFLENTKSYQLVEDPIHMYKSGQAFGNFQSDLIDYPVDTLYETIQDFHNTKKRFDDFIVSVKRDLCGRAKKIKKEIKFVKERAQEASVITQFIDQRKIPIRVTHNDSKFNNVLIDKDTEEVVCIIDLDTVMPGSYLFDFGDAIRSGASTAEEDETDLSKVSFSLELFEAFVKGYMEEMSNILTEDEIGLLPFSAKLMTYECGIRFLTDYLDGDKYFKTSYIDHNLVRAKNQFKLVEDMENKMDEMKEIVNKYVCK